MASLVEHLLKSVEVANYACHHIVRPESPYGSGNAMPCKAQADTYCDNCQLSLCKKHTNVCRECGKEYCSDCSGDHRC